MSFITINLDMLCSKVKYIYKYISKLLDSIVGEGWILVMY